MKKVMYLLIVSLFISCTNINSKLESSFTQEIGKNPTKNELIKETKTQIIEWEDVSLSLGSKLKNLTDKEFGSLPTKISELDQDFDDNFNPIIGSMYEFQVYENTDSKIELSFRYNDAKPDVMKVRLYIVTK